MTDRSSRQIVWLSASIAALMIAQQIASKAVRDGFFLNQFEVTALPVATLAAAIVSFITAVFFSKLMATYSPSKMAPALFILSGLIFLAESGATHHAPHAIASVLYLHVAAFGTAVVSSFWSVINERFDPYTARQVMGRIAGGATFGGLVGGVLTWIFADWSTRGLLAVFGVGSILCGFALSYVGKGLQQRRSTPSPITAGFVTIATQRYPRSIAVIVVCAAIVSGFIDYVFKAGVTEHTTGSLVGFFAAFYTVVGVITFGVQAMGSQRILRYLGVVPAVASLPFVALVLMGVALVFPGYFAFVILRGGAMVAENSVYRSGYELLYTSVPQQQKRAAKLLIDLGGDRLGTAAASGVALIVIAITTVHVNRVLLGLALIVTVVMLATLAFVRREYVASLGRQLVQNMPTLDEPHLLGNTFLDDVSFYADHVDEVTETEKSNLTMSRDELLRRVQERAAQKVSSQSASMSRLKHVSNIDVTLFETPLRKQLRDPEVRESDWQNLRQSAPGLIGQLGDILLSDREDLETRIRAAELLASVPSPRAAAAYLEVLRSGSFRLRRAAACGLLNIVGLSPSLAPPRTIIIELCSRELRKPNRQRYDRTEFECRSPFVQDAMGNELSPSLELVMLLLSMIGDQEQLRLALYAVTSEDERSRGTGLEYLDNLLPADLRARVLALVESPELTRAVRRLPQDVVQDLAEKLRDGEIDLRELRKRFRRARRKQYREATHSA